MSSNIPLPPREQLCNRSCINKHTHGERGALSSVCSGLHTGCASVCWLFIFKDTEPSPLRDSFRVRQQGGLPGPPPRSPSPRIHRRPDGLPRTGRAPGPHLTPRSSRRVCFVYTFFLNSPYAGVARLRSATTLFSTVAFNTLTNPLTICSLQIFLVTDLVSSTTRTSLTTE